MRESTPHSDVVPPSQPGMPASPGRRRWRRLAGLLFRSLRNLLAAGMLLEIVMVVTPLTEKVYLWLSVTGPPQKADVIVCLGGNTAREVRAAWLYRQGWAPLVVVSNRPMAAEAMRETLLLAGVPRNRILVDSRSYTTADHPESIARLPGMDRGRTRFLIVTDHAHSRRAEACFRKAGYRHTTFYAGRPPLEDGIEEGKRWRWRVMKLPSMVYELSGLLSYWFGGVIDAPWSVPSPYLGRPGAGTAPAAAR